jgi:hypothetical protein
MNTKCEACNQVSEINFEDPITHLEYKMCRKCIVKFLLRLCDWKDIELEADWELFKEQQMT